MKAAVRELVLAAMVPVVRAVLEFFNGPPDASPPPCCFGAKPGPVEEAEAACQACPHLDACRYATQTAPLI